MTSLRICSLQAKVAIQDKTDIMQQFSQAESYLGGLPLVVLVSKYNAVICMDGKLLMHFWENEQCFSQWAHSVCSQTVKCLNFDVILIYVITFPSATAKVKHPLWAQRLLN